MDVNNDQKIIWEVIMSDGKRIEGPNDKWQSINDIDLINPIQCLNIIFPSTTIHLPPKADKYHESKTASCNMDGSNLNIESHNYEATYGDKKLVVSINNLDNGIYMRLEDLKTVR